VHAESDARVLHAQAQLAQMCIKGVSVRYAGKVGSDAASAIVAAVYASEIHESNRRDVGGTNLKLQRRNLVVSFLRWTRCGSTRIDGSARNRANRGDGRRDWGRNGHRFRRRRAELFLERLHLELLRLQRRALRLQLSPLLL